MIDQHLFLSQIAFFRIQTRFLRSNELISAQDEHRVIIDQIAGRNGHGAEDAMRIHVGATRKIIMETPTGFFPPEPS